MIKKEELLKKVEDAAVSHYTFMGQWTTGKCVLVDDLLKMVEEVDKP